MAQELTLEEHLKAREALFAKIREEWYETCRRVHAGEIDSYDFPWQAQVRS